MGTLGRYKLRGELGRGAMAIIHRGYDPRLRRVVAIKTLREEYAQREDYRYRFLSEARAAGTLMHPGIVTTFDVGVTNEIPFIAMELLEGTTLDGFVAERGRLPLRTVLKITTQIADALDYAHRNGVVHQDIKPENIAVTSDSGNVKVMDFGIARVRDEETADSPATDDVAGTPPYMAPEQIRRGEVDGRTDLYALGVLLYWMLSGNTPFQGATPKEVLTRALGDPLPPLKPLDPDTPDELIEVARTLLARDPADRYQSGGELIEDLRGIDDAVAEREGTWSGRRIIPIRVRWTLVMSALVAVTVALGLGVVYQRQSEAMTDLAFDYGRTLTGMLAVESAENLLLEDYLAIKVLVEEMARNREIVHLAVTNTEGVVVASADARGPGAAVIGSRRLVHEGAQSVYAAEDEQGQSYYLFESPVLYQEHELGRLTVGLSTDALQAASRTTLVAMIAVLLVILLTVFIGAYTISRRLVVPIEMLRRALTQITHGHLDSRIRTHRNDEFERVFSAYNAMADSLEARMLAARSGKRAKDTLEQVGESVSDTILLDPEELAEVEGAATAVTREVTAVRVRSGGA